MSEGPESRRDAILDASVGCFSRYGYRRTSMDLLARAAGLSRPALYLHFASKDDLFRAMVGRLLDTVLDAATSAASVRGDFAARLHAVLQAKLDLVVGPAGASDFRAELLAEATAQAGDLVATFQEQYLLVLERMLSARSAGLDLRGVGLSPAEGARLLLAAVTGIEQEPSPPDVLHARLDQLVALTVRGLRATP